MVLYIAYPGHSSQRSPLASLLTVQPLIRRDCCCFPDRGAIHVSIIRIDAIKTLAVAESICMCLCLHEPVVIMPS